MERRRRQWEESNRPSRAFDRSTTWRRGLSLAGQGPLLNAPFAMATLTEALAVALAHHRAGRLDVAEQIYRRILAAQPDQADAMHLLGVVAHQAGRHELAIERIQRAIALRGTDAAFHCNLGEAYRAQGRGEEAIACCRRAIELKPDYAEALHNLGVLLAAQEQFAEAIACYAKA